MIDRLDEPIAPIDAEVEYQIEDGRYCLQEVRSGRFGRSVWSEEFGDPQEARDVDELKSELGEIRSAISRASAAPAGSYDERLKQATIQAVLAGELDVSGAKQVAELSAVFDGGDRQTLSDSIENPKDLSEVGSRALLQLLDDPDQLARITQAAGKASTGFLDGAVQGSASNGAAEGVQEADDVDEGDGGPMSGVQGGPLSIADLGAELDGDGGELDDQEADVDETEPAAIDASTGGGVAVADGGELTDEEVADAI